MYLIVFIYFKFANQNQTVMGDELSDTKDLLQNVSDWIHVFCRNNIAPEFVLLSQRSLKFILLAGVIFLVDFALKFAINFIFRLFFNKEKFPVLKSIYLARITNSVSHLMAVMFGKFALESIFYRHPQAFGSIERLLNISILIIIGGMLYRGINATRMYFSEKQDFYKIMALNAISQTVKIFGLFILSVIAICVIFGISGTTVLGSLGAVTAMVVLVFRDVILGFVTGIHVSTSKNLKVGDWVGIPKYNIEGNISEISLLTTKITNFDKTVSTIPTYDFLTTEIRNYQVMTEGNLRRIKRSMIFNTKSFKFLDENSIEKLKQISLVKDYLDSKEEELHIKEKSESDKLINGRQLTNIGVFRKYVENYLRQNEFIEQNEIILVRQLELMPQGMPLEIYCFTIFSALADYERVQADIFDHLMVAVRDFDLEITQTSLN